MTNVNVNLKDFTANDASKGSRDIYFFTGKFANGFYIGFWSHSPWGNVHNQNRGWAVIDPATNTVVDTLQTYYWGSCSANFHQWMKDNKAKYGKMTKLGAVDFRGNFAPFWKMSD